MQIGGGALPPLLTTLSANSVPLVVLAPLYISIILVAWAVKNLRIRCNY